jgi:CRISPR-associated endonuclease/helicase Cas3
MGGELALLRYLQQLTNIINFISDRCRRGNMTRVENKAARLLEIEAMLLAYPEGLTQAELARRLEVNRSTINRCLADLPKHVYVADDGRWLIDRSAYLVHVRLDLNEAMALHLATRLLATRMDRQNPHAAAALRKLGISLERLAPRISQHMLQSADTMDDPRYQRQDPIYLAALERLTLAWAERRAVQVWHRHEDGGIYEYTFCPYFIEPYAVGQSTHVIGLRRPPGAVRTFKIERLERVELLRESYDLPPDFDPRAFLGSAWGIWYTEGQPVRVALRFSPGAARRVKETRWHPTQQLQDLPDGALLWEADVAEPREMLPWIRGWGADVEVLEPGEMREKVKSEVRRMAKVYQMTGKDEYLIAHIRKKDKKTQSLLEHLRAVSDLAGKFSNEVGLKETGEILGLLHDFGKASEKFQNYLLSGEGFLNPDADGYIDPEAMHGKIDHSTAGAQVIYDTLWNLGQKQKIAAQVLGMCLASHHSGLINCIAPNGENNFKKRMGKPDEETHKTESLSSLNEIETEVVSLRLENVSTQIFEKLKSLQTENLDSRVTSVFKAGLLFRFLLSCLIDADRLDTADFETPGNTQIRNYGQYYSWETLIQRLDIKLSEFNRKDNRNEVDKLRTQVSQACFDFAAQPKGIYQLTVPTGGGKTLASLRFAINHSKIHEMARVFYIIPYTSIIDQNADEIRKILEDKDENGLLLDQVVLEHHSNLTPEEETYRQNLLAQNWDAPIVLTTQVQFLEALFGSGTRSARRMHQFANSVIILDEVQKIPINVIHMLNVALRFLVENCGATVVLCTATQPPLEKIAAQFRSLTIRPDQRIIQTEQELFQKLKRVEVFDQRKVGGWVEEDVCELAEQQLLEKGSVLIIVNTKKSALLLYQTIADKEIEGLNLYHLSTNMCPAHRLTVLNEVKEKLNKEPVICVSTQLIEAGVDIDFGSVIRYLAGLDSIAQSAGRCNRHGARPGFGNVWIINPKQENIDRLKDIVIGIGQTNRILDDFKDNPESFGNSLIGPEAMAAFYKYYFEMRKDDMSYKVYADSPVGRDDDLFNLLSSNNISVEQHKRIYQVAPDIIFPQSFQSAAKAFQVINSPSRGVIVQYKDEGKEIVAELCSAHELEKQYKLLKRAQRYSVNLFFPEEFNQLLKIGAINEVQPGTGVFYLDKQYYSDEFGWSKDIVGPMEFLSV